MKNSSKLFLMKWIRPVYWVFCLWINAKLLNTRSEKEMMALKTEECETWWYKGVNVIFTVKSQCQWIGRHKFWRFSSSGMWCCVVGVIVPNSYKELVVFSFRVRQSNKRLCYALTAWPGRWRQYDHLQCWRLLAHWHNMTSQQTWYWSDIAVITSDLQSTNSLFAQRWQIKTRKCNFFA